jgi:hypothetical protein
VVPPASPLRRITCPSFWKRRSAQNSKVVSGYVAGQDIDLAVERGEVMCRRFTVNAFFAREPFITWRKKNFVRVLYQTGAKRDPRIKDVPLFNELMDKYKNRGKRPPTGESRRGRG